MATVCVRVQDSVKCLVPWTIFQTDDGITLSELFERIKAGRVVFIAPSQDLVNSSIEKTFIGKSIEKLYYSAGYDPICYYCASEEITEVSEDIYPLCSDCTSRTHVHKRKTSK